MIDKKDLALVIDTNILKDIIPDKNSENIKIDLENWLKKIIENMDKHPKGKKITIFASINTIHDYETGLSKAGYKNSSKNIKMIFDKSISQTTPISKPYKIDLSLKKINVENIKSEKSVKDKNDKNFLLLSERITKIRSCSDYEIIFASKDRQSAPEIKDVFSTHENRSRMHVVKNLELFEALIKCQGQDIE